MLDHIQIVLVRPSHPGNIGSTARAMKTMGLTKLCLVEPKAFPHPEAVALSAGAEDILSQATVVPTLNEALSDSHWVIGTSSRDRSLDHERMSPRQLAKTCFDDHIKDHHQKISIVFGCERTGLTNDELMRCHHHVVIPANPLYASLNLAQAVQIIVYELRVAMLDQDQFLKTEGHLANNHPAENENEKDLKELNPNWATGEQVEGFYQHLEQALCHIEVIKPQAPQQIMPRLRRLFQRVHLDQAEYSLLRGICKAMLKR